MNIQIMLSRILQAIVDVPVWCLLLLKITAILALAWLVHMALFGANPRWRVLLWRTTAAGLIALPAIVWLLPAMQIRFIPWPENEKTANQGGSSQNIALTNPTLAESLKLNPTGEPGKHLLQTDPKKFAYDPGGIDAIEPSLSGAPQFTSPQFTLPRNRTYPISLQNTLMAVWLGGVFILAMRACIGHYRIWQIARRAGQSPESLRNECGRVASSIGCATPVEIVESEKIRSPLLCGLWRPLLLLPARMCEASYRGDLPGIFAHELTHVRCHDLFWNAGLHVASILLWFHPLAWRLRKAHLAACELVCDAVSAVFVGDVSEYCRTLARVAVDVFSSHPAAGIAMARLSTISRRLEELKKGIISMPLRRHSVIGFGIAALLVVAVLGVIQFAFAAPPIADTGSAADKNGAKTGVTRLDTALSDRKEVEYESHGDLHLSTIHELTTTKDGSNRYLKFPSAEMEWSLHETGKSGFLYCRAPHERRSIWEFAPSSNTEIKDFEGKPLKTTFYGAFSPNLEKIFGYKGQDTILVNVGQIVLARTIDDPNTIYILKIEKQLPDPNKEEVSIKYAVIDANSAATEVKSAKEAESASMVRPLQVQVVDEAGKPLAEAKVNTWYQSNKKAYTTDADGKVTIEGSESFINNLRLDIHAEGHVPVTWWSRIKGPTPPSELTLTMERAQTVGGLIQDEQGKPIQGVKVELLCPFDQGLNPLEPVSQTDSEGRWKYDYAPKDLSDINITLQHPEYIDRGLIRPSALEIEKLADRSAIMVMKRGIAISGTVTGPDGKPVANALVAQGRSRFSSTANMTTRTDHEGHYRLTLVNTRQDDNVLTVVSPGLAPDLRQIDVKNNMPPVDFRLEKGSAIRIRVEDKEGKPVEGANISPDTWRGCRTLTDTGIADKTDKDGRWTWTWAPKQPVEMSIYKSGYMSLHNYPLTPKDIEQVVKLNPPLVIFGNVVDAETKKIIPTFQVIQGCFPIGGNGQTIRWIRDSVMKGDNGRYKLVINDPWITYLRIEADGYKPEISREFKNDEGEVTCDFSLHKGKILNVAVQLPDGKPAAGADVLIAPEDKQGKPINTVMLIKNGRFALPSGSKITMKVNANGQLPIEPQDGDFLVIVVHDQGYAQTTSRELLAHPEIKLEAWARLEGIIRQGGKPMSRMNIHAHEDSSNDPKWTFLMYDDSIETDADGKFLLPKLRPGRWRITGDYGIPQYGMVDLAPGQMLNKDFNAP